MTEQKKVLIFLSGRGTNCQALIEYQRQHPSCGYQIIGVMTDKPDASGLSFAKDAHIPVHSFTRAAYPSREAFLQALFTHASALSPDYFVLAGFMVIIPPYFIAKHRNHIINIHPSLLPAYPGLKTHERALANKEQTHGCTVHFVNEEVDGGALIAQARVQIDANDSFDTLAAKVLEQEHTLYPWCLSMLAKGHISFRQGIVQFDEYAQQELLKLNFVRG